MWGCHLLFQLFELVHQHGHAYDGGPRVGDGLCHEHSLQFKEVRQNQQERNQENHLAASVEEHGPERFSGSLEKIASQHAEGNHEERRREDSHGPCGEFLQFGVFGGKRGDKRFGLPHHGSPAEEHERTGVNERELERFLDAVVESCSVIVTDDRLRSVDKSQKRKHDNRDDAVDNAESGNSHVATRKRFGGLDAYVAVSREAPRKNRVHEAVANLHHRRWESQNVNLADIGDVQLHVAPANLDGRGFFDKELRNQAACD